MILSRMLELDEDTPTPLDRAIAAVGGASALAAALDIVQSAIGNWKARGRVPAEKCLAIEKAAGGAVTRYELRPDVFGDGPESATRVGLPNHEGAG